MIFIRITLISDSGLANPCGGADFRRTNTMQCGFRAIGFVADYQLIRSLPKLLLADTLVSRYNCCDSIMRSDNSTNEEHRVKVRSAHCVGSAPLSVLGSGGGAPLFCAGERGNILFSVLGCGVLLFSALGSGERGRKEEAGIGRIIITLVFTLFIGK